MPLNRNKECITACATSATTEGIRAAEKYPKNSDAPPHARLASFFAMIHLEKPWHRGTSRSD
jgi:hypothetical protein